jgi:pyruvate-formate lyase
MTIHDGTIRTADHVFSFADRLAHLVARKREHTAEKQRVYGSIDVDDHGSILLPEPPDEYTAQSNHPSGGSFGNQCLGENFGALLAALPPYVHAYSSLLGAWYINPPPYRLSPHWPPDPEFGYSHLHETQQQYSILAGIGAQHHFCPEVRIGFELGWGGILNQIRHYAADPPDGAEEGFYAGHEAVLLGIQVWMRKHVDRARELAGTEANTELRANLLDMAAMNERLITDPPKTYQEACQFIAWVSIVCRQFNGSGGIGQLDEILYPFYQRDVEAGVLDEEEAIFHLICMFLIDTQYYQIGGPGPDGKDRTNRVSFLILEALHRMRTTSNVTVRVWEGLDEELFDLAVRYLFEDRTGSPRFIGEKGMTEGFMRNGYSRELARERVTSGCHWAAIPGKEYPLNDVIKLNFAAVFDVALRDMVADPQIRNSVDNLWACYEKHLRVAVACIKQGIDHHLQHMYAVQPELPLNLLMCHTLERGRDVSHGGVDYYNIGVDGAALATVADSFAAVAQRVEQEGRLSWEELIDVLDRDYADAEPIRLMLKGIPRFGSGGSLADECAVRVTRLFETAVSESPTPKGTRCIPGLFSWASTIGMGKSVGATPNGRHARAPISHGANPDPGFKDGGAATAQAMAVLAVQCRYGNTTPLQMELDPGIGRQQEGIELMKSLIRTYGEMGGTLMNLNVLSREQVLEAHEDPEKYPDLIVRVTGFSAYFRMLSKDFRQLVVDRIVSEN